MKISLTLLLALLLGTSGCSSYLTTSGRQQAAYARYVRKQSKGRVKLRQQIVKAQKPPRSMGPSDPVTTTSTGPESVTAGGESH